MKTVFKEHYEWIDIETRNCFQRDAGAGIIKCVIGYNHYGVRNYKINQEVCTNTCPRYKEVEDLLVCDLMQNYK